MIGKTLNERHTVGPLPPAKAIRILSERLASQATHLVAVRAKGPRMIACLVVEASKPVVRLCRALGVDVTYLGTGVFGLLGDDASRLFDTMAPHRRAWLEASCGPRETKVLLLAGGTALLTLTTDGGKVTVTALP